MATDVSKCSVDLDFVSVSCNAISDCVQWSFGNSARYLFPELYKHSPAHETDTGGQDAPRLSNQNVDGLVAFAAGNFVGLYDVEHVRLRQTLRAHTGRVNCVSWVQRKDRKCAEQNGLPSSSPLFLPEIELLSAGCDGLICYWKYAEESNRWILSQTILTSSGAPITGLATLELPDETVLAVCSSTDGSINVLLLDRGEWTVVHRFKSPPKKLAETLDLALLPGFEEMASFSSTNAAGDAGVILATGGVDSIVRLHTVHKDTNNCVTVEEVLALKGHLDWIRSIQFSFGPFTGEAPRTSPEGNQIGDLMLASASQDGKVRLWRIRSLSASRDGRDQTEDSEPVENAGLYTLEDEGDSELAMSALNNPLIFNARLRTGLQDSTNPDSHATYQYQVAKEAVLVGHEGWVTSIKWFSPVCSVCNGRHSITQPMQLLSTSQDKSVVIWSPESRGVWIPAVRFGTPRTRGVGYFGGSISPLKNLMLCYDHRGSFFSWKLDKRSSDRVSSSSLSELPWSSVPTISGHFEGVNDLCWDHEGRYLVTASSDKTVRLFCLLKSIHATEERGEYLQWHEVARPQTHGYEMVCLTLPVIEGRPHTLVSGGDEKILRVFDAPSQFLTTLRNLGFVCMERDTINRPNVAYVPELQLSNKGTTEDVGIENLTVEDYLHEEQRLKEQARNERKDLVGDTGIPEEYGGSERTEASRGMHNSRKARNRESAAAVSSTDPEASRQCDSIEKLPTIDELSLPTEELLSESTLWAETQKLYGHGNELLCVASTHDGTFIASACKAKHTPDATIRLWRTDKWIQEQELEGHEWSVVQLEFSRSDEFLVSVSKDRHFCVFQRQGSVDSPAYRRVASVKAHKRIIWTVSFCPDDSMFATGSRDGSLKLWSLSRDEKTNQLNLWQSHEFPSFDSGVTSLAFAPEEHSIRQNVYWLAVGCEDGSIHLYKGTVCGKKHHEWEFVTKVSECDSHCGSVTRLLWRPQSSDNRLQQSIHLASSSSDHSVRIFNVTLAH
eukprot:gb/GECG01007960.1/.p1 GENE.gb/GECG01007960.1/~~gb/GECG01007960.1/.p1  ORF type:complete len:1009 (+),score=96.06 gb/GECG01007960.1/:1-3027(+)